MTVETFFANFGHLADAPNGVQKLRELILQLAVQGKLVPQDSNDEPASVLLEKIAIERKIQVKAGNARKPKECNAVKLEEQFCSVPVNWCWARMGELILGITGGGTPSKNNPSYWDGDIPWASVKDVGKSKYLDSTVDKITAKGLEDSSSNLIPKGRVIVCTRMGLGKISINRIDVAINQDLKALWLPENLEIDYFYNFFLTQDVKGTGMTVAGIRQDALLEMPVPLPPLEEQKRIVAKIEQLMTLCDELEARQQKQQQGRVRLNNAALDALLTAREPIEFADHWQRISTNFDLLYDHPETIAKLRAAILQLAVQGKLVPQDPNDEPVSALLERIKAEKERLIKEKVLKNEKALPDNDSSDYRHLIPTRWCWTDFQSVTLLVTDGEHSTPPRVPAPGVPMGTAKNVRDGYIDLGVTDFVSEETAQKCWKRCHPEHDDILMVCVGATTGRLTVIKNPEDFILVRSVALIRPCSKYVLPEYLAVSLRSPVGQMQIWRNVKQSAQPCLYIGKIKGLSIPLPPLEEQKRIVAKVDQLMTMCDKLEAKLNQTQQHREKLMEATVQQLLVS